MHLRDLKYMYKVKIKRARFWKLKEGNQGCVQETNNMKNIYRYKPNSVIMHSWNKITTSTG